MHKQGVIVWLRSIEYTGGNIGKDTAFNLWVNGNKTPLIVDMEAGTTRFFDKVLFMQGVMDQDIELSISANVVEKDFVDDEGANSLKFIARRVQGRQAVPPLRVAVQENLGRVLSKGPVATFTFTVEAEYLEFGHPGVRYVVATDSGWLLVRGQNGAEDFSLPYLLQVQVTRVTRDREFFTVLEGPLRGTKGSVRLRDGVSAPVRREPGIQLLYHKHSRQLEIPELGTFRVASHR